MASLCHPWFTTTNLSYRFPIFETSATALCGTTGKEELRVKDGCCCCCGGGGGWPLLDQLGAILGAMLACLRAMLAHLGARLALLGAMWAHLGAMLAHLGAMWAQLAAHLGPSGGYGWASFRAFWSLCWAKLAHLHKKRKNGKQGRDPLWRGENAVRQCHDLGALGPWPDFLKAYAWQPGAGQATTFWLMVWEDWAEILRANPGRAMLNWGRHNAQCLPVWKQSGPMLSAGCAHVGPSRAHVEQFWAHLGLMLGQVGPMLSHRAHLGPILAQVGPMLGYVGLILGPCWAYVGPMLALCGLMLSHLGSYVGAMFGPCMLKRS